MYEAITNLFWIIHSAELIFFCFFLTEGLKNKNVIYSTAFAFKCKSEVERHHHEAGDAYLGKT